MQHQNQLILFNQQILSNVRRCWMAFCRTIEIEEEKSLVCIPPPHACVYNKEDSITNPHLPLLNFSETDLALDRVYSRDIKLFEE